MLDRFAPPANPGSEAGSMQAEELLDYLRSMESSDQQPLAAVLAQTEAIGDPAVPAREHAAVLDWLGKALDQWERQFPLEEPLATQLRRLKPLCATLAIVDPQFMYPGAHPLHRLLDSIQARAVGWQADLDRVGAVLEQQVITAIENSSAWLDDPGTDLSAVCDTFTDAVKRDRSRASRMVQRVVETEVGRVRTSAAKREAALMINAALEKYPVPAEIGEFVKGPWYTSAQLLLLKFGADSEQWQKMSETTDTLLDSLQSLENAEEERRQYIFEVVTQLPKEMRRWLLSLHHDTEAVNEAMGLVEYAHLRILRRQPVDMQHIEAIAISEDVPGAGDSGASEAMEEWQEGQWFFIDEGGKQSSLRAQLVLKLEQEQQLLFTNLAGIKVRQLGFAEFLELLQRKSARPMDSGNSFSLCLANAAGIETPEVLTALVEAFAEAGPEAEQEPEAEPEMETDPEAEPAPEAMMEAGNATGETTPPGVPGAEVEVLAPSPPRESGHPGARSIVDIARERGTGSARDDNDLADNLAPEASGGEGFLADQAQQLAEAPGETGLEDSAAEDAMPAFPDQDEPDPYSALPREERQINLATGTWLGFHDGEVPMMARLAVHDPEHDYFIFVNRKGIKLRQLSKSELLHLIDEGLVDILRRSSNFRDEVTAARKNLDKE